MSSPGRQWQRRAEYMFGALLPRLARGPCLVGAGDDARRRLGRADRRPTTASTATGDTRSIDGVRVRIPADAQHRSTGGDELLPARPASALCMAENANGAMHNVLTPRGALVRDAHQLERGYLLEARRRYRRAHPTSLFTSHFWPRWGSGGSVGRYLTAPRPSLQPIVHNESVRLMNSRASTLPRSPRRSSLPAPLARAWFNRPNYGSAQVQRPRRLPALPWRLRWRSGQPRSAAAGRARRATTVAAMGGAARRCSAIAQDGRRASGDDRWAATLLGHLVRAEPANAKLPRKRWRSVYEQLAYRAEAAPWRDFYLSRRACELRQGVIKPAGGAGQQRHRRQPARSRELLDTMSGPRPPRRKGRRRTVHHRLRHPRCRRTPSGQHRQWRDDPRKPASPMPPTATLTVTRTGRLALIALVRRPRQSHRSLAAGASCKVAGDHRRAAALHLALFEPPKRRLPARRTANRYTMSGGHDTAAGPLGLPWWCWAGAASCSFGVALVQIHAGPSVELPPLLDRRRSSSALCSPPSITPKSSPTSIGEPFGTLAAGAGRDDLIEVALIVSLMFAGGPDDDSALARDTVFAAVMIILNGIVGICDAGRRQRASASRSFNLDRRQRRADRALGALTVLTHACCPISPR